jgi:ribonuclease G
MTRQRLKQNIIKTLSQPCPYCYGRGHIKSVTTVLLDILRRLKSLFVINKEKKVILQTHPNIAKRLREENLSILEDIQKEFGKEIVIESVSDFSHWRLSYS